MKFKRVLLKLSGEQFAGNKKFGIDPEFVSNIAKELKEVADETGVQIAIVVGGGNFIRGANLASHGLDQATGDYMGMLATVLNGMSLVDTLEANGQPARLQSRLQVDSVAEPYIRRRAIRHMEKGRLVIVAGGTGNPFVTTDTASVVTALELNCEVVLKATKVEGVYDKDPIKYKDAKKHDKISHSEALQNPEITVMDNAAISLAMDHKMPIIVFDLNRRGNIKKVVSGQKIGTQVSS